MIEASPNTGFMTFFESYLRSLVRRSFRNVWMSAHVLPESGFVAAANHTSWWDGFVPFLAQRRLAPGRQFAVMMDEKQLRRFPLFRWGGAFSIDASHAQSASKSVHYAGALAAQGAGVWIFPEGRIAPPHELLPFKRGFVHAARHASVPIVPVALRFVMLEAQRPDAFISFGEAVPPEDAQAAEKAQSAVVTLRREIDDALERQTFRSQFASLFAPAGGIDDVVAKLSSFGPKWS